jgi:uncharacterized protein (TIGR03435 family)
MRKLCLLGAFAATAFSQPAAIQPRFEVATVKLNKSGQPFARGPSAKNGRFTAENLPLKTLISYAYEVLQFQTTGPAWLESDRYDVAATLPDGTPAEQVPRMLRTLLEDRFKLETHREAVEQNVYALLVEKGGAKFLNIHPDTPFTPKFPEGQAVDITNGTVTHFGEFLSAEAGRPVVDHTGIKGEYRLVLTFVRPKADGGAPTNPGPDLFTAVREELGLRLEPRKEPVEMLRVDRAERIPEGN